MITHSHTIVSTIATQHEYETSYHCVNAINVEYLKPTYTEFAPLMNNNTYTINRLPERPEFYIDPKIHVRNDKKHRQTCIKNRKKRKSKRKR